MSDAVGSGRGRADTIEVYLNGKRTRVRPVITVEGVVTQMRSDPRGVAVALNEEVVPRSRWAATRLTHGDRIEVLVATQGG